MQFNSLIYLAFSAVAATMFWLLPARFRRAFVLGVSMFLYFVWSRWLLAAPLAVAALLWLVGRNAMPNAKRRSPWIRIGWILPLVALAFFKYSALFSRTVQSVFRIHGQWTFTERLLVPLGISFFTFEAISYVLDLRQRRVSSLNFVDSVLYMLFWPTVAAGPILRAREIIPQLKFSREFEPRFAFEGMDRLLWGVVLKNVFANTLAVWVNRGFSTSAAAPSSPDAWLLAIAYALQIYFDFSAYTHMAIGTARLLGLTLPENFRQPYHAANPSDFWSRWHMTLSRWIRDYLFFPINAKYKGAALPLYVSLIGAMGLVGLWHGAGWTFAVWGLMHGVYLVLYRIYETRKATNESRAAKLLVRAATLVGVTAAWVPFRATTFAKASDILSAMFARFSSGFAYSRFFYAFTALGVLFCIFEPLAVRTMAVWEDSDSTRAAFWARVLARPLAYCAGMLLFMMFDQQSAGFIYTKF